MGKQTKGRVKKITVVLIAVFLVVALTVTSACAKSDKIGNSGGSNHNAKYGDKVGDYNKGDKVGNTGSSYNKGGYNRYDWYSCWRWDSYSGSWVWAC